VLRPRNDRLGTRSDSIKNPVNPVKKMKKTETVDGKGIVEKQKEHGWGKSIVEKLAGDLQKEFPGLRGLSSRNIWNMKNFHSSYKDNQKLQPLVAEISWATNIKSICRLRKRFPRN